MWNAQAVCKQESIAELFVVYLSLPKAKHVTLQVYKFYTELIDASFLAVAMAALK